MEDNAQSRRAEANRKAYEIRKVKMKKAFEIEPAVDALTSQITALRQEVTVRLPTGQLEPWQKSENFSPDAMSQFNLWLVGLYPGFTWRQRPEAPPPTVPAGVPPFALVSAEAPRDSEGRVRYQPALVPSTDFTAACRETFLPIELMAVDLALAWAESRPEAPAFQCFSPADEHAMLRPSGSAHGRLLAELRQGEL
jgi:hypothetical protein